jgi:hypothetical protein
MGLPAGWRGWAVSGQGHLLYPPSRRQPHPDPHPHPAVPQSRSPAGNPAPDPYPAVPLYGSSAKVFQSRRSSVTRCRMTKEMITRMRRVSTP